MATTSFRQKPGLGPAIGARPLTPWLGSSSPTQIEKKAGTLIQTSLLEDLVGENHTNAACVSHVNESSC